MRRPNVTPEWEGEIRTMKPDAFLDRAVELAASLGEKTEEAEEELTDKLLATPAMREAWMAKWFPKV